MLQSREGQRVPEVTFPVRAGNAWKHVSTAELFDGKKVVVFSLPGAFTPTCSSSHLPRYNELAATFFAQGVDAILCISVNDTFVMNEWLKDQEAEHIIMVPDGNGTFSEGMGMLVDKTDIGFGKRSWRYSMLVDDGVVTKMFIEPDEPGDPFKVSDADTMLDFIAPEARKPDQVAILSRPGCPSCAKAKQILTAEGYQYADIPLPVSTRSRAVGAITRAGTVPQVFINGVLIGGAEALEAWVAKGKLQAA